MKQKLALNFLMSQSWALDKRLLSIIGDIANRDVGSLKLSDFDPSALEGRSGSKVGKKMEIREGGVALIHVDGVISRYASMFDDICGGTSTEALARDLTQARHDMSVNAIVLYINSQGGHADGIHEFSEMVYQVRSEKPIIAYVGGEACSAAYWLASAADEVVIDATARVGSIGTVVNICRRKQREDDEFETLEIVSSQSPNKRLDPGSKEGREAYQKQLDELADVFIERVARNMGVSVDTVLKDFGGGGVSIGQSAVEKGMAHRLGSLEGVIAELQKGEKTTMKDKKTGANSLETSVTCSLPSQEKVGASALVEALTQQRPDVISAIQGEPPEMALVHAADIVKRCAEAGVPTLSARLLKDGVTLDAANSLLSSASSLKDKLSAAGLSGSFDALISSIDNPVEMVGKAIHEVKAAADENSDQSRQVVDKGKPSTSLNTTDIYAKRKS
ncbi:S49 family peptidase [Pseudoalteromonas sp. Of7M-16]|uniref:S49 family peptidase n=1 Tax=Pseudoalteromonas sp. Of7M-16 TaxID=2917756 RepID=UPI001EF4DDB7|nr:S49 family peptidase [Pseudoalteromonas sp. Of7M-16]MCG7551563.1 S49 family peptidase [Pseudoalteromonas sp. Of7M-16]